MGMGGHSLLEGRHKARSQMTNMGGDVGPESSGGTDGGKQGLGVWGIVGRDG